MLEKTLDNSEKKISVKMSLMNLVQNNHVVRAQASIAGNLQKQFFVFMKKDLFFSEENNPNLS